MPVTGMKGVIGVHRPAAARLTLMASEGGPFIKLANLVHPQQRLDPAGADDADRRCSPAAFVGERKWHENRPDQREPLATSGQLSMKPLRARGLRGDCPIQTRAGVARDGLRSVQAIMTPPGGQRRG